MQKRVSRPLKIGQASAIFLSVLQNVAAFNPARPPSHVPIGNLISTGSHPVVSEGWKPYRMLIMNMQSDSTPGLDSENVKKDVREVRQQVLDPECPDLRRGAPKIQQSMLDYMTKNDIDAEVVYTDASLSTRTAVEAADALGISDASRLVKSLVFVAANGVPLLVLAPGISRVNISALRDLVHCRVRLATPEEAQGVTGHEIGCIPPFSPTACSMLQTYMDASILKCTQPIFTGAGVHGGHIRIYPQELQRASNAIVWDVIMPIIPPVKPAEASKHQSHNSDAVDEEKAEEEKKEEQEEQEDEDEEQKDETREAQEVEEDEEVKLPPPNPELNRLLLEVGNSTLVECRAEVLRVRKIAKRLRFGTLRLLTPLHGPSSFEAQLVKLTNFGPWQLIAGKTIVQKLGAEEGDMRIKELKNGCHVAIKGTLKLNWKVQSPDIIVHELEFLDPPPSKPESALERPSLPRQLTTKTTTVPAEKSSEKELLLAPEMPSTVTMVEEESGLNMLIKSIEAVIDNGEPVGIDAEWRPHRLVFYEQDDSELIAVLQLSTRTAAFVIDMLTIQKQPETRNALRRCLHQLFCAPSCPKLGFALYEDVRRLERCLPGTTEGMQNVLDLQPAASQALGMWPRRLGLDAVCARLLGLKLDKSQQVSDWSVRPLSPAQVRYAVLDAFVLMQLFDFLSANNLHPLEAPSKTDRKANTVHKKAPFNQSGHGTSASPQQPREATSRANTTVLPVPPIATRYLQLNGMDTLLKTYLGVPMHNWQDLLKLCASGNSRDPELDGQDLVSSGGRGSTRWEDGAACFCINRGQRGGKYQNKFWREPRGSLAGQLLFSWWPGRGQFIEQKWLRSLFLPDSKALLFVRLKQKKGQPFYFCGRLAAAAVALPMVGPRSAYEDVVPTNVQVWNTSKYEHVIWRLVDAEALMAASEGHIVDELFGVNDISVIRPPDYLEH